MAARWDRRNPYRRPPEVPAVPDGSWTKARIIVWLRGAGVDVSKKAEKTLSKPELLEMVEAVRSVEEES